jgi:hypothetical protein
LAVRAARVLGGIPLPKEPFLQGAAAKQIEASHPPLIAEALRKSRDGLQPVSADRPPFGDFRTDASAYGDGRMGRRRFLERRCAGLANVAGRIDQHRGASYALARGARGIKLTLAE